jgi:hypothetical protein
MRSRTLNLRRNWPFMRLGRPYPVSSIAPAGLISLVERGFWTYKLNKDGNKYADLLEEKSASLLDRLREFPAKLAKVMRRNDEGLSRSDLFADGYKEPG